MNKTLLLLALMLNVSIFTYSQKIYPTFIDGRIYLILKDNAGLTINVDEKLEASIKDIPFLQNLSVKYNMTRLTRPFHSNRDKKLSNIYKLEFKNCRLVDDLITELKKLDIIEVAEKVPLLKTSYTPNDTLYNSTAGGFNWHWWETEVNAQNAWNITKGDTNVIVGVSDIALFSGHPDLQGQLKKSWDVANNDNNVNPPAGLTQTEQYSWSHGTHISGIIAAVQDNHIGISGIAPHVGLAFAKATPDSSVSGEIIYFGYEGVQWLADNGAKVINMSWSSYDSSSAESYFLNSLYNQGIILVAAAGNDGKSIKNYPAAYQHVIAVASTNDNDIFSTFSTYGPWVTVSAPGGSSTIGTGRNRKSIYLLSTTFSIANYVKNYFPNQNYDIMEGTSMATPVVAGICGLMASVKPDITPDQVRTCLMSTARDLDTLNSKYKGMMGAGRVDAYKALLCVQKLPAITADFTADNTIISVGQTVNFTDKSTGNPTSWSWSFDNGNPSSSNQENPSVLYSKPGKFSVSLTAKKDTSLSTITKSGYITVYDTLAKGACDTIRLPQIVPDTFYWGGKTIGYYTGNNSYDFLDLAEYFSSYEYMQANKITGAKVVIGVAKGSDTSKVTLAVWKDSGGSPVGNPIATKSISYNELSNYADMSNPAFTKFNFDNPVPITGPFYMGIELPTYSGDSLALTCSNLKLPSSAWVYTAAGGWENFQTIFSGQLNVRLAIYPIVCNTINSINEFNIQHSAFSIYPNPANTELNVELKNYTNVKSISIFDLTGRQLNVGSSKLEAGYWKLNVASLSNGIYFIQLLNSNGTKASAKFVKN